MQETNTNLNKNISEGEKSTKSSVQVRKFLVNNLLSGVLGFAVFFLLAIFFDYFLSIFDPQKAVKINTFTFLIGFAGFFLSFGFSFLEKSKK